SRICRPYSFKLALRKPPPQRQETFPVYVERGLCHGINVVLVRILREGNRLIPIGVGYEHRTFIEAVPEPCVRMLSIARFRHAFDVLSEEFIDRLSEMLLRRSANTWSISSVQNDPCRCLRHSDQVLDCGKRLIRFTV